MSKKDKIKKVEEQVVGGNEDMEKLQAEFDELQQRFGGVEDQLKRAVADYHNLEKRIQEGRLELSSWATAEVLKKMLPVLDHLEKALNGASESERQSGWYRGVELAVKQFGQVLKEEGLEEIVAEGQFNPALHEAVDMREPSSAEASAGKGDNDTILEVVEKGYNLNSKILRPARVVVGRSSS